MRLSYPIRPIRTLIAIALVTALAACEHPTLVSLPADAVQYAPEAEVLAVENGLTVFSKTGEVPAGVRKMTRDEVSQLVTGKVYGITYSDTRQLFEYAFTEDQIQRRRRAGGRGSTPPEIGTYTLDADGILCARWNVVLCYEYYTDGSFVTGIREFRNRRYADVYGPPLAMPPVAAEQ